MKDHDSIKRFPLEWPVGWVRTVSSKRQRAAFRSTKSDTYKQQDGTLNTVKRETPVSVLVATQRLERQIDLLGGPLRVITAIL